MDSLRISGLTISLLAWVVLFHHISFGDAETSVERKFWIADDKFWKDGKPYQIIGGDLHYFRVHPQYWKDRLLRAKALGLHVIQTYVPWNIHEPRPGEFKFDGFVALESFLNTAQNLGFLVMLRIGPYICAEWDFGGLPAWLLGQIPSIRLRSSDPSYLSLIDRWWGVLLPKVAPFIYSNGGSIIMVQIENEYGSYGSDKEYLRHLATLARFHLGDNVILYTTDSRYLEHFQHGTIPDDGIYAAIDFPIWFDPVVAFDLQKQFNAPGKSPYLSSEFYTGWLTHWGEEIAHTNVSDVAAALESVLSMNASVVLYMAHGGTNFGFFSGAETGVLPSIYQADITSYDYDAPIAEDGDTSNEKFKAIRDVIEKYSSTPLPTTPDPPRKKAYGAVKVEVLASLFDVLEYVSKPAEGVQIKSPVSMEALGQSSGFILYKSRLPLHAKTQSVLHIQAVHDRAQVFVDGTSKGGDWDLVYLGITSRWSNLPLQLPLHASAPGLGLYILVESMGHVNYGNFLNDSKGIVSSVLLDSKPILGWTAYSIQLNDTSSLKTAISSISSCDTLRLSKSMTTRVNLTTYSYIVNGLSNKVPSTRPMFYYAQFNISEIYDTFLSMRGWTKGITFLNGFNLGRYWPIMGPQCTLYIPAPLLQCGENELIIFELEKPAEDYAVHFVSKPDFTCGKPGTFSRL